METSGLFLREVFQRRQRALRAYSSWEEAHRTSSPLEEVLAQLDAILDLMPSRAPEQRVSGDYEGVRILHAGLAVLGTGR